MAQIRQSDRGKWKAMRDSESRYWAYFDEAWKKILERFFPQFLQFFVPRFYHAIDFQQPFAFLDKEMEQLSQQSQKGAKVVDKLVKVFLKDGSEEWILIHIEVQADEEEGFSERMFRYFYRIFDRHGKSIASLAILTGSASRTADGVYERKVFGSGVEFRYLPFNLMDYERQALEIDDNPMALVVLASQHRERHRRSGNRFNAKLYLIRKLYERGYSQQEIIDLFEFIDWVIQLSDEEENRLWQEMQDIEEEKKMPYITSIERIGIERGLQRGLEQGLQQGLEQGLQQGLEQGLQQGLLQEGQQMILEALDERFGEVPGPVSNAVHQIKDQDRLRTLHRQAIRATSLAEFQQYLNGS